MFRFKHIFIVKLQKYVIIIKFVLIVSTCLQAIASFGISKLENIHKILCQNQKFVFNSRSVLYVPTWKIV